MSRALAALLGFAIAIAIGGCAHAPLRADAPPASPDFRAGQPPPLARQGSFNAPVPAKVTLDNGLTVLVAENHALPLVSMELVLLAGADAEPAGKAGIASLTARLLLEGTETRSALELAGVLDDLAINAWADAQEETTRVHLSALGSTLPEALALLAEIALRPGFRAADVDRLRSVHRTELLQKQGNPVLLARDAAARALWGEANALGQPAGGNLASLAATSEADIRQYHSNWYRPSNAVLSFAGDVTFAQAEKLASEQFGSWKGGAVQRPAPPDAPAPSAKELTLVPREGSQSQVWSATLLPFGAADPRTVKARLLNFTLGGSFTSRINTNVRETKGYSYGVFSRLTPLKSRVVWTASGGIVADKTAEALAEYQFELRRMAEGGVTEAELEQAKQSYIRLLPSQLETNDAVAGAIGGLVALGLPLEYYRALPEVVRGVTREELRRVAAELVEPGKWRAIVVGPGAAAEKLKGLGIGEVRERAAVP